MLCCEARLEPESGVQLGPLREAHASRASSPDHPASPCRPPRLVQAQPPRHLISVL